MKTKYLFVVVFTLVFSAKLFSQEVPPVAEAFAKSLEAENKHNYFTALEELKKIYEQNSSNYLVNLRLGWLYFKMENYKESIKFYNQAVRLSNNSIEALLGLVYPLSALKEWDKVESIYLQVLDKDEKNYTANLNLGIYYFNSRNYLNAKKRLEMVCKEYPSDYSANLYLGWTLFYIGDRRNALKHFTNALMLNNKDSSALEGIRLSK